MRRDPFYKKIIVGLSGTLDPDAFEECAADLLRADWKVSQIRGGQDSGMDGAVADGEAEPYPLVCTTRTDVIGNLSKNLSQYVMDGGSRRKVLLATSQSLTPRRIINLERKAKDLGFALVQTYTRETLAHLLYHDSRWCKELLGITGTPPALSKIPMAARPGTTSARIGRDEDIAWLTGLSADAVLLGQPGSGKTFCLTQLTDVRDVAFVVTDDIGRIAESLRDTQPEVIIVDDAHVRIHVLRELRRFREESGIPFVLLACSWPGRRDVVQEAAGVSDAQIRTLDLFTRDEMVMVIQSAGLARPRELIREIVNQSEGRPGLAATFAHLCLQGDVHSVLSGEALFRAIGTTFKQLIGEESQLVLAAFSVGGTAGMPLDVVAEALGISVSRVQRIATEMAAGGVLREVNATTLGVQPEALRYVLVRDTYFRGAFSLPLKPLLDNSNNFNQTIAVLIGVQRYGGIVPDLAALLERAAEPSLWHAYACVGEKEAQYILGTHPELLQIIADAGLHFVPRVTIPLLLDVAVGDLRKLSSNLDHPLRRIEDWIKGAVPIQDDPVERRLIATESIAEWLNNGGDIQTGVRALAIALKPEFEFGSVDPGAGNQFIITRGWLTVDEITRLGTVWDICISALRRLDALGADLRPVLYDMVLSIQHWVHPKSAQPDGLTNEALELLKSRAGQMITELAGIARDSRGLTEVLRQMALRCGIRLDTPEDRDFVTLFPGMRAAGRDWQSFERLQKERVNKLAGRWEPHGAVAVANEIAAMAQEASHVRQNQSQWAYALCDALAKSVISPVAWADGFISSNATSDLVYTFLHESIRREEPRALDLCEFCLTNDRYEGVGVHVALQDQKGPDLLNIVADGRLGFYSDLIEGCVLRDETPNASLVFLLKHKDSRVASAAAAGYWHKMPNHNLEADLRVDWEAAVLVADEGYWLSKVFVANPELALKWLLGWLPRHIEKIFRLPEWMDEVLTNFDSDQRSQILASLPHDVYMAEELLAVLIGGDSRTYATLLELNDLKKNHLIPLSTAIGDVLVSFIQQALDAGYSVTQVTNGVRTGIEYWSGPESAYREQRAQIYRDLLSSAEGTDLRQVLDTLVQAQEIMRDRALMVERHEAIYGR